MQARVTSGNVTGASAKTILAVLASATRRVKLKQLIISCTDTPADAMALLKESLSPEPDSQTPAFAPSQTPPK